jgi:nucleotide-binding universal stress UspA family protein
LPLQIGNDRKEVDMTKILACVDGSRYSASVCDHAAWAAGPTNASVEVLHVLDRPHASGRAPDYSGAFEIDMRETLLEELTALDERHSRVAQQHGWLVLDEARGRLMTAGVRNVDVHQRNGSVVETIVELEGDVDLVVMGKRGASADSARHHLGSNLERVVRASRPATLVVPESFVPIRRALVAFDGGPSSRRAIERLARWAQPRDVACHILMVGSDSAEAVRQVSEATETLDGAGYAVSSSIESGHVERVIVAEIANRQIDLLVMGAYGHARIRELIIGSTTTLMLGICPVAVLVSR